MARAQMRHLLARAGFALAAAMLRLANRLSAVGREPAEAADGLADLRSRFPGAPEHWLRVLAEHGAGGTVAEPTMSGGRVAPRMAAPSSSSTPEYSAPNPPPERLHPPGTEAAFSAEPVASASGEHPGTVFQQPVIRRRTPARFLPADKPVDRPQPTMFPQADPARAKPPRVTFGSPQATAREPSYAWSPAPRSRVAPDASIVMPDTSHAGPPAPESVRNDDSFGAGRRRPLQWHEQHQSAPVDHAERDHRFVDTDFSAKRQVERATPASDPPVAIAKRSATGMQPRFDDHPQTARPRDRSFAQAEGLEGGWVDLPPADPASSTADRAYAILEERRRLDALVRDQTGRTWSE